MHSVSVFGAGIGAQHLAAFAALPDIFHIDSIVDLDPKRAQPLAAQYNTTFRQDLDKVLEDQNIDIIDICLPPHLHFDVCCRALSAGKSVICEKPLVTSLKEADALVDLEKNGPGRVFPVFQYRYGQGTAQLHAVVQAGLAGKPIAGTLETHWNRDSQYYDVPWRGSWAGEGGGAILGHAIHIHDLIQNCFGPVAQVFADLATNVNAIEVEDCGALSIRMTEGALVTSSVSLGAASDTSRLRLIFEHLTVESAREPYAPANGPWVFTARDPANQAKVDATIAGVGPVRAGYAGLFSAIAESLDGQGGREVSLMDGRRSLEFVSAVYASARSNAPVHLPLNSDHPLYSGWLP